MFFSEYFQVDAKEIEKYGSIDISLACDNPFFIDPMLIFHSTKKPYRKLHDDMIRYFHFLAVKAQQPLSKSQIDAWFYFREIPNNWLGYSLAGNKGKALADEYAKFLSENIGFVINNEQVSQSHHIEKAMLLHEGSGKDKISDLTVNLIQGFLAEYTQTFAKQYIPPHLCEKQFVDKVRFDYTTEQFVGDEYFLPVVPDKNNCKEYVLLTPQEFLRESEPSINRKDFLACQEGIRASIENENLRMCVNDYLVQAIRSYEQERKQNKKRITEAGRTRAEKHAFAEAVKDYPVLYDYYIRLKENEGDHIREQCSTELIKQSEKFILNSKRLIDAFDVNTYLGYFQNFKQATTYEKEMQKVKYFKHIIENCNEYHCLYVGEERVTNENDLTRIFRPVWCETQYRIDLNVNGERDYTDFMAAYRASGNGFVHFKLASNKNLSNTFAQVSSDEHANRTDENLFAVFCFTDQELSRTEQILKTLGCINKIGQSIFLIDCKKNNKV